MSNQYTSRYLPVTRIAREWIEYEGASPEPAARLQTGTYVALRNVEARVHEWNGFENYSNGDVRNVTSNLIAIIAGTDYGQWRDSENFSESEFRANSDLIAALDPETVIRLIDELVCLRNIVAQGNVAYAGH